MDAERCALRVLCIDGGGMRGLYTVTYLASLARRYAVTRGIPALDVGKGFNLIVGTSTGAIIACALAAGISLDKVARLYRQHGKAIFPIKLPNRIGPSLLVQLFMRSKYLTKGAIALDRALHETLGDLTLADVYADRHIALAIPAVEMARHHSWVFKTPHLANSKHRDDGYRLVDACLATTAAPIFRSMASIPNPDTQGRGVFVDGGLWANNPVLVGLIDALEMTRSQDKIEIYCLGTCPRPAGDLAADLKINRGLVGWKFGGAAAALTVDAQEFAFHNMARMLAKHVNRKCSISRFPQGPVPDTIMRYLDLDETSEKAANALVEQAQADVNLTLSRCGDLNDADGRRLDHLFMSLPPLKGTYK